MRFVCASALLCLLVAAGAGPTLAQENAGVHAQLSWSSSLTPVTDLGAVSGSGNSLYILLLDNVTSFKGAEFDLRWSPPGNGLDCFAHIGTTFRTATTCTYLNRGTSVPVTTVDDLGIYHVAWANNSSLVGCTAGAIVQITFDLSGCTDPTGVFSLCSLKLLDQSNGTETVDFLGVPATVLGGGSFTTDCNQPPVLNAILDVTVASGDTARFTAVASDPDGDAVLYSITEALPQGATFNGNTGEFVWATMNDNSQVGTHTFTVTADDQHGGTAMTTATVIVNRVNHPPDVTPISSQTVNENDTLVVVPSATDVDTGDIITWSGTNLPPGATVDGSTGTLRWVTDTSSGETNGGFYSNVTLTATDNFGGAGSATFTITVIDLPPTYTGPTAVHMCTEGTRSFSLTATDDDVSATLTWSSTDLPTWATLDPSTGELSGQAPADSLGTTIPVTVTITESGSGQSTVANISIVVDCTPVTTLVAQSPVTPFNRHAAGAATYPITFEVAGSLSASRVRPEDVRLVYGTESIAADAAAGVRVDGRSVTVGFVPSQLATLLASVSSGSTADATLLVTVDGEQMSGAVRIAVTGLAANASLAARPNLVRSGTTIEYTVPEDGAVRIAVYAVSGRLVRSIANGSVTAGVYSTWWDGRTDAGSTAPGGIYYLRGSIGGTRLLSRVVLLR